MSSSRRELNRALAIVGKVSKSQVRSANGSLGTQWVRGFDIAEQTVQTDYPKVTSMMIAGAKAHQSHEVQSHSNVISVKFFEGEKRVISGHVHMNGRLEYSKKARGGGSDIAWQPTREQVDQAKWTIYDSDLKKHRKVMSEGDWWFVEIGGNKVWF